MRNFFFSLTSTVIFLLGTQGSTLAKMPLNRQNLIAQKPQPSIHDRAKAELPEDYYIIYRITERLIRANDLDNLPWRIFINPKYEINAYATENNLIALYGGIIDQLSGIIDAIDCVIGHEISHHTEKHIALSPKEEAAIMDKIEREAIAQVENEISNAQVKSAGMELLGGILGIATGQTVDMSETNQTIYRQAEQRMAEIIQMKEQELLAKIAENNHRQEFEADHEGLIMSLKAGFKPQGCLDLLGVLERSVGSQFDGKTHPATPRRISQIKKLIIKIENQASEEAGEPVNSQMLVEYFARQFREREAREKSALTYSLSRDRRSILINPQGGSSLEQLENRF